MILEYIPFYGILEIDEMTTFTTEDRISAEQYDIDYSELLIEIKRTTNAFQKATLKSQWNIAFAHSNKLTQLCIKLEIISNRKMVEQRGN